MTNTISNHDLKNANVKNVEFLAEKINQLALSFGEKQFDNLRTSLAVQFGIDEWLELASFYTFDDGIYYARYNLPNLDAQLLIYWHSGVLEDGGEIKAELQPSDSFNCYALDALAALAIADNVYINSFNIGDVVHLLEF